MLAALREKAGRLASRYRPAALQAFSALGGAGVSGQRLFLPPCRRHGSVWQALHPSEFGRRSGWNRLWTTTTKASERWLSAWPNRSSLSESSVRWSADLKTGDWLQGQETRQRPRLTRAGQPRPTGRLIDTGHRACSVAVSRMVHRIGRIPVDWTLNRRAKVEAAIIPFSTRPRLAVEESANRTPDELRTLERASDLRVDSKGPPRRRNLRPRTKDEAEKEKEEIRTEHEAGVSPKASD